MKTFLIAAFAATAWAGAALAANVAPQPAASQPAAPHLAAPQPAAPLPAESSASPQPIVLTGQNAVYDLGLARVRNHSVTGAAGRLHFNVLETCRAYAVSQHMTLLIRNENGSLTRTESDYDTWESKNGHRLSFLLRQTIDGTTKTESSGEATTGAEGGAVNYTVPKGRVVKLPPGTLFPMAHTRRILEAAASGKSFIDPPLFDGTSTKGAEHSFVAILGHDPGKPSKFAPLANMPATKVDIGFFSRAAADNEPEFRTQMRYYANGVARGVKLDFGDFVVSGALKSLSVPPSVCGTKE